ncbi:hypothetical protein O9993_20315 [Vibrio lentus]|nr:hypothetical protein [Vibrio lentus]
MLVCQKAPSTIDPIYSLERATNRRNVVLRRMLNQNNTSLQRRIRPSSQ